MASKRTKKPPKPRKKLPPAPPLKGRVINLGRGSRGGTDSHWRPAPGGRPPAWQQERLRDARKAIAEARDLLGRSAVDAVRVLLSAMNGDLPHSDAGTQQNAADRVLKKVGLGDVSKLDVIGGPSVVVRFGEMKHHPSPAANSDGVEPDGAIEGTERDE